ncbi:MAG: sulfatase-like hydrolase/transferase, partial [Acidobacteriota bacterium]
MLHSRHTRCSALLALILLSLSLGACDEPTPPDLLIVSLDTVRADRLGLYGYDRPTSPHLDALAAGSVVFDQAITQAVITGPSHSTLLTGLYPPNHGVWRNGVRLDDRFVTLAEHLRDAGWQTAGFVGGLPMADSLSGLAQGFEIYDDTVENGQRRVGDDVVERA